MMKMTAHNFFWIKHIRGMKHHTIKRLPSIPDKTKEKNHN